MLRHMSVKFLRAKDKTNLESRREKWFTYGEKLIWMKVDFSSETMDPKGNGSIFSRCYKDSQPKCPSAGE